METITVITLKDIVALTMSAFILIFCLVIFGYIWISSLREKWKKRQGKK